MRCYLQALTLCVVFAFFSVLYVFNQLASSLESQSGWADMEKQKGSRKGYNTGYILRKEAGVAGLNDRQIRDRYGGMATFSNNSKLTSCTAMHLPIDVYGQHLSTSLQITCVVDSLLA